MYVQKVCDFILSLPKKATEEEKKRLAVGFFGEHVKLLDKSTIAKKLEEFKELDTIARRNLVTCIKEKEGGKGGKKDRFSTPPEDFLPGKSEVLRRREFNTKCKKIVLDGPIKDYLRKPAVIPDLILVNENPARMTASNANETLVCKCNIYCCF